MGFNKRFLSEDSIRSFANSSFDSFETYMTCADAYIVNLGWAEKIYHQFGKAEKTERKEIHKKIKNGTI